jgi:excisionase family DNA binding protein
MLPKEFYTTGEAAELLRISRSTISRKFDRGGISGKKNPITGERLVARESLISFMKEHNLPIEALVIEKKKVLVVTADDGFFSLIQKIFGEDSRVKAERESYGRDVLARRSKGKLNLLVIDEKFPDISSVDLIRTLRRQEEQKGLKIVCVTGRRKTKKALQWGADEVFGREALNQKELRRRLYSLLELLEGPDMREVVEHQRKWPRLRTHLPAKMTIYRLRTPRHGDLGKAMVEDISCGGAYLSGIEMEKGEIPCEPFRILMEVDQEPLKHWRADCKLARLMSNGSLTAGVQFVRISKSNLEMIQALS